MAAVMKEGKAVEQTAEQVVHRIRVTLTSKNMKAIEKMCSAFVKSARDKGLRTRGPARMPTKVLRITCRKTPCGEGSKTWDRFQMRIHKRVIDFFGAPDQMKNLIEVTLDPVVDVEVAML